MDEFPAIGLWRMLEKNDLQVMHAHSNCLQYFLTLDETVDFMTVEVLNFVIIVLKQNPILMPNAF